MFNQSIAAVGTDARILSPGNSAGTLEITGNLTLDSFTTVQLDLNGTDQGTSYDHLIVGGLFTIDSATLDLSLGFAPSLFDSFTVISYDSLAGTFAGLGQDDVITIGSHQFTINYGVDSIVLTTTAIPEPKAAALFVAFLAMVAAGAKGRAKRQPRN